MICNHIRKLNTGCRNVLCTCCYGSFCEFFFSQSITSNAWTTLWQAALLCSSQLGNASQKSLTISNQGKFNNLSECTSAQRGQWHWRKKLRHPTISYKLNFMHFLVPIVLLRNHATGKRPAFRFSEREKPALSSRSYGILRLQNYHHKHPPPC